MLFRSKDIANLYAFWANSSTNDRPLPDPLVERFSRLSRDHRNVRGNHPVWQPPNFQSRQGNLGGRIGRRIRNRRPRKPLGPRFLVSFLRKRRRNGGKTLFSVEILAHWCLPSVQTLPAKAGRIWINDDCIENDITWIGPSLGL